MTIASFHLDSPKVAPTLSRPMVPIKPTWTTFGHCRWIRNLKCTDSMAMPISPKINRKLKPCVDRETERMTAKFGLDPLVVRQYSSDTSQADLGRRRTNSICRDGWIGRGHSQQTTGWFRHGSGRRVRLGGDGSVSSRFASALDWEKISRSLQWIDEYGPTTRDHSLQSINVGSAQDAHWPSQSHQRFGLDVSGVRRSFQCDVRRQSPERLGSEILSLAETSR